jgi:hypothetical protein
MSVRVFVIATILGQVACGGAGGERVLASHDEIGAPTDPRPYGTLDANATGLQVSARSSAICTKQKMNRVVRQAKAVYVPGGPIDHVRCADQPLANADVTLEVSALSGKLTLQLGKTDRNGKVDIPWTSLAASVVGGEHWIRRGTVQVAGAPVGTVDLTPAHLAAAAAAWAAAQKDTTPAAVQRYRESFPDLHADEARALLRERLAKVVDDALARTDAAAARAGMTAWRRAEPDDPEAQSRETRVAELERAGNKPQLLKDLDDQLAAAEQPTSTAAQIKTADATITEIAAIDAGDPHLAPARTRLDTAKKAVLARLLVDTRKKLAADDTAAASSLLSDADAIAPGDPQSATLHQQLDARIAADNAREQRRAAREAAEAERKARAEEAARRVAEARAAAEAAREQQRAEQAARREQARQEAERKKQEEEQRRQAEAARKQAEADRKAAERAAAEQRKKDEAAKANAERQEQQRSRDRAGDRTLVYTLDAKFKDDNIVPRLPLPAACSTHYAGRRVKPADCPSCGLVLITSAEASCGDYQLQVEKRQETLTVTCTNRTCDECIDIFTAALAGFSDKKGPGTTLAESCKAK